MASDLTHDEAMRVFALTEAIDDDSITLIEWDHKESLPVSSVSELAKGGFVHMYPVDDTRGDFFAMVASRVELQPDEVQWVFEKVEDKWAAESAKADKDDTYERKLNGIAHLIAGLVSGRSNIEVQENIGIPGAFHMFIDGEQFYVGVEADGEEVA